MIAELKEVISKVEQLNDNEQKRIAKLLKEEIKRETTPEKRDNDSQELLHGAYNKVTVNNDNQYDEEYLKSLRAKAKKWLGSINPDEWLKEIRGTYDS